MVVHLDLTEVKSEYKGDLAKAKVYFLAFLSEALKKSYVDSFALPESISTERLRLRLMRTFDFKLDFHFYFLFVSVNTFLVQSFSKSM